MREITYMEAVREALGEELERDEKVFVLGEDVGLMGGCFGVTGDLYQRFPDRVLDTPIAETAILGLSIGAAYSGMKPVAEIMFADFVGVIYDYLINQITSNRYMTGMQPGGTDGGMVLRAPNGTGIRAGAQHSQSIQQYLMPITGIKIAIPSTPRDAKGMLKWCIREENDPVVFLEHKMLYGVKGEVPEVEEDELIPLGKAVVRTEGTDVTVVATSLQNTEAVELANEMDDVSIEVVDPRSLKPLDLETMVASVKKTGRLVLFDESPETGNALVEVARRITDECFAELKCAPVFVCAPDTPIPFAPNLEDEWTPDKENLREGIKKVMA